MQVFWHLFLNYFLLLQQIGYYNWCLSRRGYLPYFKGTGGVYSVPRARGDLQNFCSRRARKGEAAILHSGVMTSLES